MSRFIFCLIQGMLYICLAILTVACERVDSTELQEEFYAINNKAATERFLKIMYNRENPEVPIERFKMVHASDFHVSSWSSSNHSESPGNILELVRFANQSSLKINALITTGDNLDNNFNTSKSQAIEFLTACVQHLYANNKIPTFICTGNHDQNTLGKKPEAMVSSIEMAQTIHQKVNFRAYKEDTKNYYYADLPNPMGGAIRIIALDGTDQDEYIYDTQHLTHYSREQIEWFYNVALKENMTTDHSIIILNHYPFHGGDEPVPYLSGGSYTNTWRMVPEIVEAFRAKKELKKEYPNYINSEDNILVEVDFSGTPGEFIAYFGGHIHATTHFTITNLTNAESGLLPQNMFICTNSSPSEASYTYNNVFRKSNTLSDNSFCIYAIDTKEKKIYMTFFGAYLPSDQPDYPDTHIIPY